MKRIICLFRASRVETSRQREHYRKLASSVTSWSLSLSLSIPLLFSLFRPLSLPRSLFSCLSYVISSFISHALSPPRSPSISPSLSLSDTQPLTHTPKVWITDSCPMQAELVNGKGPFEVLSLAPLIASHIDLAPVEVGGGLAPRGLSRL